MTDRQNRRGIAIVDVGYSNCKVILYNASLEVLGERKIASPHVEGSHYREIETAPIMEFVATALRELDAVLPIDAIVPSAHGACIVSLKEDGTPAVPVMDYMSEPPNDIVTDYQLVMPSFAESYSPPLPMALLHGMQLFWQQKALPEDFARTRTILPLMQFVAFALGGRPVIEVSSMSCQTHLVDMRNGAPSSLARAMGWDRLYAPLARAWENVGTLKPGLKGPSFRGEGVILAGVHDSNANYLRYLAAGQNHFTLLSTGTWIIGFDTDAEMKDLDPARDIVANKDVFGKTVCCCRFFGGKEFEVLAGGASGDAATLTSVADLVGSDTMALPSFTDSGGPVPGSGGKGRIIGPFRETAEMRASLASLYCALMVSESLDAIRSRGNVIVDGPFSQNRIFLGVLSALRPHQKILASEARDGTAAGAACLALMPDGMLPKIDIALRHIAPIAIENLKSYQAAWRKAACEQS